MFGQMMSRDSWTSRTRWRGHQRSLGVKITHCIPPSGAGREGEWDKHLPHLHLKTPHKFKQKGGRQNNEATSHSGKASLQPLLKGLVLTGAHRVPMELYGQLIDLTPALTRFTNFTATTTGSERPTNCFTVRKV